MPQNKITILKEDFQSKVFPSNITADVANVIRSYGGIFVEPLKGYAGVGFEFPTVPGKEYSIKFTIDIGNTATQNEPTVTASDGYPGAAVPQVDFPVTASGTYTIKYTGDSDGRLKFYYKKHLTPAAFTISALEIYVEDPNMDFSVINSQTAPFILARLKSNLENNYKLVLDNILLAFRGNDHEDTPTYEARMENVRKMRDLFLRLEKYNSGAPAANELDGLTLDF